MENVAFAPASPTLSIRDPAAQMENGGGRVPAPTFSIRRSGLHSGDALLAGPLRQD
jgi:hypothetical protein